jgi:predicted tellurium resistance membrane protein TerC
MSWLSDPQIWIGFLTLTVLEVVLGIDNVVFISILAGRLPESQRKSAWNWGLTLAAVTRIVLLFGITWVTKLDATLFTIPLPFEPGLDDHGTAVFDPAISGQELVYLLGGLFLLWKSVGEIHEKLEGGEHPAGKVAGATFGKVLIQIVALDMVFSIDSVITAVGMVDQLWVMIAAVVVSVGFMLLFAGGISKFVEAHPTVKMLALAFLVLIGFTLVAEAAAVHIPKGYIYFSMAFAVGVEMLNLKYKSKRKKVTPVKLHSKFEEEPPGD